METKPIYLDYNATTPVDPAVAEAMLPYLTEHFGNPSSTHPYGVKARDAVETARAQVAALLGCRPADVVFTSGGTESNNMAIKGAVLAQPERRGRIITSAIEHPAVLEVCDWLAGQGFPITVLPVDGFGQVDPDDLARAMTPDTRLVTIMQANNEVGTIQPVAELARIAHAHGALFHTDAAQAVGKIRTRVDELGVDLLSVAGHKLYAPKGVGALYVREGLRLPNLLHGAGQERGLRPGTENVLEIVGLGQACELAARNAEAEGARLTRLRDHLHAGLVEALGPDLVRLNGHPDDRLPNTASLSFQSVEANVLLAEIDHAVAASAGAACHAGAVDVSAVLRAMGVPTEWAMGTVRFSVGRPTTPDEIDRAVRVVARAVLRLSRIREGGP